MVKTIAIRLDDAEYKRLMVLKGEKTWKQYLMRRFRRR